MPIPFVLLQIALPLLLKLPSSRRLLTLPQDLFLISLLLLLPLNLAFFLGWLNHLYLLADFFLYKEMKLRLEPRYFLSLRDARHWIDSAKSMRLAPLLASLLPLTLLHLTAYLLTPSTPFSLPLLLFSAPLTLLSLLLLPPQTQYLLNHPLFLLRKQAPHPISIPLIPSLPQGPPQFNLRIAPAEKPHIIFLFLESFGAKHIAPHTTPHFHRLIPQGIYFSNFYANGTFTYRALLSALFGAPAGSTSSGLSPYVGARLRGIPQLLKAKGYKTAFHHNGSLRYDMQEPFLKNHFDALTDQNGMKGPLSSSWGIDDESLMRHSANWLEKQSEPTFLTLFTISNHHPWIVPKHYKAPEGSRFLQTLHYSDFALGRFIEELREKNLSKKTVLFITGDHGQPMGEHDGNFYNSRFLYEENVRVPLLILGEGRIDEPKVISDLGSHLDLLPTIADLLGLSERCLGTSLMRQSSERRVFLHNPYSEGFVGCREGNWKWIENQKGSQEELYNVAEDPNEGRNLILAMPEVAAPLRMRGRSFVAQVDQMHRGLEKGVATNLDLSDSLITDQKLKQLAKPNWVQVHLENCLLLTDRGIDSLFTLAPLLEEVNLKGIADLTSAIFKTPLPHLSVLYLSEPVHFEKPVQLGPNLKVLSIHGKNIPHFHVENIIYLTLFDANAVAEDVLIAFLKKSPNLVRLTIYGSDQLTDETFLYLRKLPLEQLRLYGASQISGDGRAHLSELPIRSLIIESG